MDEAARQSRVEQLIDAALVEFARRGLHGARVDAIAQAAAMNKRLLYHYVGNKEALFSAACQEALSRLRRAGSPGSAVDGRAIDAWRLLCHAELEGLGLDAEARSALLRDWPGAGRADVAESLLEALLPTFAAALPATPASTASRAAAKPRLKLRPQLRPGSGSG